MMQRTTKKQRTSHSERPNRFEDLPDDLVVCILCKLTSSASSPADFVSVLVTCKRLKRLGLHPLVLSTAGAETLGIRARKWSDSAHRFLKLCVKAGNVEACYALGMIRFYCLQSRSGGASLMARAAIKSHTSALYSLAVIQFNGSGGSRSEKNLRAGVALCARAAYLGHVDALRELGHCLQDGYGVRQDIAEGRRLLVQANARELACSLRGIILTSKPYSPDLLSDFGCAAVPVQKPNPVNRFLREWFETDRTGSVDGRKVCSHGGCGRPETRENEFRRCSECGKVNYCSRACQALDWRVRHKVECGRTEIYRHGGGGGRDAAEIEIVAAVG